MISTFFFRRNPPSQYTDSSLSNLTNLIARSNMPKSAGALRITRPPVPEKPSLSELYLRDRESFFRDHPIKITPYSKILKILPPVPFPDPAQFDLVMREIHKHEKEQGAQVAQGGAGVSSQAHQFERETETGHNHDDKVQWYLDKADIWLLSSKKLKTLAGLLTLHKVIVKNIGDHLPSQSPEGGIILPTSALRFGFPVPILRPLCRMFRRLGVTPEQLHPNFLSCPTLHHGSLPSKQPLGHECPKVYFIVSTKRELRFIQDLFFLCLGTIQPDHWLPQI